MDLIFIDGSHSYRVVKSYWRNSKALTKTGTAVFFHNYGFSEVRKAVDVIELGDERTFVMKDMVAREEALDRGRKPGEEWRKRL